MYGINYVYSFYFVLLPVEHFHISLVSTLNQFQTTIIFSTNIFSGIFGWDGIIHLRFSVRISFCENASWFTYLFLYVYQHYVLIIPQTFV